MSIESNQPAHAKTADDNGIPRSLIDAVCQRLARGQRVRRTLPAGGRLHIDRQLPFLCVYRRPANGKDEGTELLVKGEASYLVAPSDDRLAAGISQLVREVATTLGREFGAFLIIEIWASPEVVEARDPTVAQVLPTFVIHAPARAALARTIEGFSSRLRRVKVGKQSVDVHVLRGKAACQPSGMPRLLTETEASELNCAILGLAVPPVYRQPSGAVEFPLLLRTMRGSVSLALRQACFEFARSRTSHRPPHYHALGRRAVVKAVWDVDRQLATVSNQFDYLLQVTPLNTNDAWKQFQRGGYEQVPEFHYRPLPIDPAELKRKLYSIPISRVEDPALQRLFQEKQEELELQLTMLRDRDTPRFLYESLQLFGGVSEDLWCLAVEILNQLAVVTADESEPRVDAHGFAERAEAEFDYYRQQSSDFKATAKVSSEVSGLTVSRGRLLINVELRLSPERVEALLAHEVGTHLLTYYNGRMQPFQQLYSGLAGYEELQEGLAVLSEYLVDGLSRGRMRQLAARVVAVRHLTEGASFVDTFRVLTDDYGFAERTAYQTTMRVYRGGGLTKDAVYLRGLRAILVYVQKGGDLNPLMVGKMALEHIATIKELQHRRVLAPASMVPRYLRDAGALSRLDRLRGTSGTVLDLVN